MKSWKDKKLAQAGELEKRSPVVAQHLKCGWGLTYIINNICSVMVDWPQL